MASRKEQKEQARARRLAEERAMAERAARQRRLQMLIGAVLAAAAVVAVAIAISSGGGGSTGLQKGTQKTKTQNQVSSLLAGIQQSGTVLGNPKAPVTMTYYGDLECPICKDFTLSGGFPELVAKDVRQGKVKVDFRSFCTATCNGPGPTIFDTQQVAAYAAGKQNLFWNYTELFYHEQGAEGSGYVNETYLNGLAGQIPGLNVSRWQTDRNDATIAAQVQSDGAAATAAGVQGTPTLVFKGPKGTQAIANAIPSYSDLKSAIDKVA